MPTLNPRVNVTLSPSLDSLVVDLAALQGVSKAQVLRELLEAAEPALQRAVALMTAAAGASSNVRDALARSLDLGMMSIEDRAQAAIERAERGPDLVVIAERVKGRKAGSRRDAEAAAGTRPSASLKGRLVLAERESTPVPLTGGLGRSQGSGKQGKPVGRKGVPSGRF